MYWEIRNLTRSEALADGALPPEGASRFVLHRHEDRDGAHFDLRIEEGNCLLGWRISGEAFEAGCWATEKMPHPPRWLDEDGDAHREDEGVYVWRERGAEARELALHGRTGVTVLRFERAEAPPVDSIRALAGLARAHQQPLDRLEALAADGLEARRNAIARFCGLSRELDGEGFDEEAWRRLLHGMSLREIGARLAKVETRHDLAHPPEAASRPEPLPDGSMGRAQDERLGRAMRIAQG